MVIILIIQQKELGIELVGDIKVKIETNNEEDPWDEIVEESNIEDEEKKIDEEVKEDFIKEEDNLQETLQKGVFLCFLQKKLLITAIL